MVSRMRVRKAGQDDAASGTELGQMLRDFRWRFQLTQKEATQVLGVGMTTLTSYEVGYDTKTRLSINPRPNTLELMAGRMHEYAANHGQPYSCTAKELYQQLMVAAGKLSQSQLDRYRGTAEPPTDEQLERGDLGIPELSNFAASSGLRWGELTPEERRMVAETMAAAGRSLTEQILAGKKQRKLR